MRLPGRLIWSEGSQIILIVTTGGRKSTNAVASQHKTTPASVRQQLTLTLSCCARAALPPMTHPESLAAPGDTICVAQGSHRFCDTALRVSKTTTRDRQDHKTCTECSNTDTLTA